MRKPAKKQTALDGFTVDLDKMSTKDEATRLVGILDMLAVTVVGEGWHDAPEKVREAAQKLYVPYLALWLMRDLYVDNPSVTLADIEAFLSDPIALPVFRKWAADLKEQKKAEGEG